jgi:hypothetical protein
MIIINPFDFFLEPDAETFPFYYESSLKAELGPYLAKEPAGKGTQGLPGPRSTAAPNRPTISWWI